MMAQSREQVFRVLREERAYLREEFGVASLALFGSFAGGDPAPDSDVDLMVTFDRPIGLRFMDLCDYLESKLERPVDVLTLSGLESIRNADIARDIKDSMVYV